MGGTATRIQETQVEPCMPPMLPYPPVRLRNTNAGGA